MSVKYRLNMSNVQLTAIFNTGKSLGYVRVPVIQQCQSHVRDNNDIVALHE